MQRPTKDIMTVKGFAQRFPTFSEGALRWMIFRKTKNGFDKAFVKVGRRLLIDVEEFFSIISELKENGAA